MVRSNSQKRGRTTYRGKQTKHRKFWENAVKKQLTGEKKIRNSVELLRKQMVVKERLKSLNPSKNENLLVKESDYITLKTPSPYYSPSPSRSSPPSPSPSPIKKTSSNKKIAFALAQKTVRKAINVGKLRAKLGRKSSSSNKTKKIQKPNESKGKESKKDDFSLYSLKNEDAKLLKEKIFNEKRASNKKEELKYLRNEDMSKFSGYGGTRKR